MPCDEVLFDFVNYIHSFFSRLSYNILIEAEYFHESTDFRALAKIKSLL